MNEQTFSITKFSDLANPTRFLALAARILPWLAGLTALVLAVLPVSVAGYFLLVNPTYLMAMWDDHSGQRLMLGAFALQVIGCVALWRMLRSI